MSRQIFLDTETTGLNPESGDRIVEIGCIEMVNRVETGQTFHAYFNPERDMPAAAEAVHGLSIQFLSDKPLFAERIDYRLIRQNHRAIFFRASANQSDLWFDRQ